MYKFFLVSRDGRLIVLTFKSLLCLRLFLSVQKPMVLVRTCPKLPLPTFKSINGSHVKVNEVRACVWWLWSSFHGIFNPFNKVPWVLDEELSSNGRIETGRSKADSNLWARNGGGEGKGGGGLGGWVCWVARFYGTLTNSKVGEFELSVFERFN